MRAAARPHVQEPIVTHVAAGTARQALIRLMIAVMATLALLVVWRPTVVHAQEPAPKVARTAGVPQRASHVVRAGESLFSLAVQYYGDGNAWTELARLNSIPETASRPLVVGMRLVVPPSKPARVAGAQAPLLKAGVTTPKVATAAAATPRVASADTPARSAAAPTARAGSSLSAQTAGKGDAAPTAPKAAARARTTRVATAAPKRPGSAAPGTSKPAAPDTAMRSAVADASPRTPMRSTVTTGMPLVQTAVRIGLVEPGASAAARGAEPTTIFIRRIPTLEEAQAQARAAARPLGVVPRRGEYEAAPFVIASSALLRGGRILRRVGAAAAGSIREPQRVLIADDVEITAPAGVTLAVGDRLQALQDRGAVRGTSARVAQPGGVLIVTETPQGKPVVARLESQSGTVEQGQALLPITGAPAATTMASTSGGDQLRATVRWVENDALLPTLQSYILLDAGSSQGVQAGDEFALVKTRGSANTGEEQRIAVVRVVRSDASGSTAVVVRQDRGEIAPGVAARRVARIP